MLLLATSASAFSAFTGCESAATLVLAFVASGIDYRNAVLAYVYAPKATTDKLQRVLNAAARVVTGTKKFERGLPRLLHTELHWLDVDLPQRVIYYYYSLLRHKAATSNTYNAIYSTKDKSTHTR